MRTPAQQRLAWRVCEDSRAHSWHALARTGIMETPPGKNIPRPARKAGTESAFPVRSRRRGENESVVGVTFNCKGVTWSQRRRMLEGLSSA